MSGGLLLGWVDVDDVGQRRWSWPPANEAFGVGLVGGVEHGCPLGAYLGCGAPVDRGGGVVPDAGVAVVVVVPAEEVDAEVSGVVDAGEPALGRPAGTSWSGTGSRRTGCHWACAAGSTSG